jgi:hypothetical protein
MNRLNIDNWIFIFKYLNYKSLFNMMSTSKFFYKLIKKYYRTIYSDILNNFNKIYTKNLNFEHATSLKIFYEELDLYDIIINKYDNKVSIKLFYNILNEALMIAHYKHLASVLIIKNNEEIINNKLYKYLSEGDIIVHLDNYNKIKNLKIYINSNNYLNFDTLEIGYKTYFKWKYKPYYWCRIRDKFITIILEYNDLNNIKYDIENCFVGHATDIYIIKMNNWRIVFSEIDLIEKAKINEKTLKLFFKIEYEMDGYCGLIKNILFTDINDFDDMYWAIDYYTEDNKELESINKIFDLNKV